jgi:hypothetical protein
MSKVSRPVVAAVYDEAMGSTAARASDRERAIADARRSSALEGARSTDATRADQDAYVRGEIDIDQLGDRVRARYGLA